MVIFSSIDSITIPGVYNEMRYNAYSNEWVKNSEIEFIDKNNIKSDGRLLDEEEIWMISSYTEENGSWKYELIGSEDKYLHSDGKIYDYKEKTDYPF